MQPVIQDFVIWFGRFVFCSTIILVAGHFIGRKMRARKAALKAAEESKAQPETNAGKGGMRKLASRT